MNTPFISTNGVKLHVVQAGSLDGKLLIFLHGFPEFWFGWRHQIDFFAQQGFRVWVPDQRGYNLSDKPKGLDAYNIDQLAGDVVGLIDAANVKKAYIVGHDWGASVAWWTAITYPERVERLVILNVPHPVVMRKKLQSSFAQLRKSWYIFFFQLSWLPEALARMNNFSAVVQSMQNSSRPGTFNADDLKHYRAAWAQPNAYTSMLNWYRAIAQRQPKRPPSYRVTMPTLIIWGVLDKFLGRELAQESLPLCDHGQLQYIDNATHWVQHEEPARVNRLINQLIQP
jgi:pimeloyl-ACP methyl ester carboxylesterase